ncbi:protease secretion system outer membrane protein [Duganella sp. 3397]|uniref:TolC family outer membrane protein n=1 Tax=Duganella sp. 3397 TaxID=2817732 RepID=UPI0028580F38|nr:TolC family outer membrane protein [Duganella sp. 3397]MDR7051963.1 protease secretion system outer membrane protein [Duganella sp. 3397]
MKPVAPSILLLALLYAGSAHAVSLMQAYQAALQNDPGYRAATFEYASGIENEVLGRSALLPAVSASYSSSRVEADVVYITNGIESPTRELDYRSKAAVLQVRQPVFSLEAIARYHQGLAQTSYATAVFASRKQELILRLAGAYTEALFANTQLRLAEVQRDVFIEQRAVNTRLFDKGEGTRTDMLETEARLDLAEAQVLEAQDNVQTTLAALSAIVGQQVNSVDDVAAEFRLAPDAALRFDEWRDIALRQNPDIIAMQFAVESSKEDINKARAGHTPRVDLVASYAKNNSDTLNTLNQDSKQKSIGFQVNIPLYSGGAVSASSRQAVAATEKAKADQQATTDKVLVELRKQHAVVVSSVARLRALDKAVASGTMLVTATEQSIKGGVRINLDLLNARQQLYTSRRDQAQARYGYLLAMLKLRSAAGVLDADALREVAAYFR